MFFTADSDTTKQRAISLMVAGSSKRPPTRRGRHSLRKMLLSRVSKDRWRLNLFNGRLMPGDGRPKDDTHRYDPDLIPVVQSTVADYPFGVHVGSVPATQVPYRPRLSEVLQDGM
jgi:hypothetical protein